MTISHRVPSVAELILICNVECLSVANVAIHLTATTTTLMNMKEFTWELFGFVAAVC